jgi:hypothetical protein
MSFISAAEISEKAIDFLLIHCHFLLHSSISIDDVASVIPHPDFIAGYRVRVPTTFRRSSDCGREALSGIRNPGRESHDCVECLGIK